MIKTDLTLAAPFLPPLEPWLDRAAQALDAVSGYDFTGWLHLPTRTGSALLDEVEAAAARIRADSEVLLVIGIGGSYLGARAARDLLCPSLSGGGTKLLFTGNGLSGQAARELLDYLRERDFSVNVISKSGSTTEPAAAFRLFYELLKEKYGAAAPARVYATTDAEKGALLGMAKAQGFTRFVIPGDVGGRYSVLTPVGLLPMAAAGIDVRALLAGARAAELEYRRKAPENPVLHYAAARQALYAGGKKIEVLSCWEPRFRFFAEWWKQLFGESEGKDGKGLFPASLELTADLHSMGQYMQQGERLMFETMLYSASDAEAAVPFWEGDPEGLNYLAGKGLDEINRVALTATATAHAEGGVPCLRLDMPAVTPASVGNLFYFFELSCAVSAILSGVNPFDQPGVENYKQKMFALLGKPQKEK